MKVDAIVEKILSDAKREAEQMIGEAAERCEEILRDADAAIERERDEANERARLDAQNARERMLRMAKIEQRKVWLSTRRGLLDRAFVGALAMLRDMPMDERCEFFQSLILNNARGGETAVASRTMYKLFQDEAASAFEKAGVLLECDQDMAGDQLILKKGDMQIDLALEAIVEALRPPLEPMVDAMLFKEEG